MKYVHPLIVNALHQAFEHVVWQDWRTHLEWDFADTSFCYRHFDQTPYTDDPILQASYERELDRLRNNGVPPRYRERQIRLYTTASRDREGRWKDIEADYLNEFYTGFTYMDSAALIFYMPAVINRYYDGSLVTERGMALDSFLFRLRDEVDHADFKSRLSKKHVGIVADVFGCR